MRGNDATVEEENFANRVFLKKQHLKTYLTVKHCLLVIVITKKDQQLYLYKINYKKKD